MENYINFLLRACWTLFCMVYQTAWKRQSYVKQAPRKRQGYLWGSSTWTPRSSRASSMSLFYCIWGAEYAEIRGSKWWRRQRWQEQRQIDSWEFSGWLTEYSSYKKCGQWRWSSSLGGMCLRRNMTQCAQSAWNQPVYFSSSEYQCPHQKRLLLPRLRSDALSMESCSLYPGTEVLTEYKMFFCRYIKIRQNIPSPLVWLSMSSWSNPRCGQTFMYTNTKSVSFTFVDIQIYRRL